MSVVCITCGHADDDDARFCSSCGSSLDVGATSTDTRIIPITSDPDTGDIRVGDINGFTVLPAGSAVLVVKRGALEGVRYPLDIRDLEPITIGRTPDSSIFLDDVTVSRKHAQVTHASSGWVIADAGSLNGTYVNRERVESIALVDEDEVQIGKYRFVFLSAASGE
ncbi:MAG: FHA domain-containing protein [Actinomycetes bacterium]